MAEDSGAFKTNSAGWRQTRSFVMTWACDGPGGAVATMPHPAGNANPRCGRTFSASIFHNRLGYLTLFSISPDSFGPAVSAESRTWPVCRHRVPDSSKALADPCEGGTRTYAPRFPFSVRRDHAHLVDFDLWAWRGGAAARRSRGLCQQPVMARGPRNNI